jgi:WD40 repeat protein
VAVSPDGSILATGAFDDTVKLWSTSSRQLLRTLTGHLAAVNAVAFTPDGQFLVSGGEFLFGGGISNVKLWRVADGALVADFKVPDDSGDTNSLAVSRDGSMVVTGQSSGEVNLYRTKDGALLRTLIRTDESEAGVAFAPDGLTVAAAGFDGSVRILRTADGTLLRTLVASTLLQSVVAFSPDGTTLAAGGLDHIVRLYRTSDFRLVRRLDHGEFVQALAFSPDSQTLASAGSEVDAKLWRVTSGTVVGTLGGSAKQAVTSLVWVTTAKIMTGGSDSHAHLWRVSDGTVQATFGAHTGGVASVAFSPDGTVFASGSFDFTAKLWRASDGTELSTLEGHNDVINAVAFSADGTLLATAAGSPPPDTLDSTIQIWSVATGTGTGTSPRLVQTLAGHAGGSTGVAFSRDGQTVISSGRDGALRFWRVADGTLIRAVTSGGPEGALAISPDRTVVATASTGTAVNLYSTVDGTLLRSVALGTNVNAVSFSGDGTLLAVGTDFPPNNLLILRVADGTVVRTLPGDAIAPVQGVAFAPDGHALASSSGFSHVINVWDPATGALLASYDQETGASATVLLPVAYSPDSTLLGFGRGDATVVVARG